MLLFFVFFYAYVFHGFGVRISTIYSSFIPALFFFLYLFNLIIIFSVMVSCLRYPSIIDGLQLILKNNCQGDIWAWAQAPASCTFKHFNEVAFLNYQTFILFQFCLSDTWPVNGNHFLAENSVYRRKFTWDFLDFDLKSKLKFTVLSFHVIYGLRSLRASILGSQWIRYDYILVLPSYLAPWFTLSIWSIDFIYMDIEKVYSSLFPTSSMERLASYSLTLLSLGLLDWYYGTSGDLVPVVDRLIPTPLDFVVQLNELYRVQSELDIFQERLIAREKRWVLITQIVYHFSNLFQYRDYFDIKLYPISFINQCLYNLWVELSFCANSWFNLNLEPKQVPNRDSNIKFVLGTLKQTFEPVFVNWFDLVNYFIGCFVDPIVKAFVDTQRLKQMLYMKNSYTIDMFVDRINITVSLISKMQAIQKTELLLHQDKFYSQSDHPIFQFSIFIYQLLDTFIYPIFYYLHLFWDFFIGHLYNCFNHQESVVTAVDSPCSSDWYELKRRVSSVTHNWFYVLDFCQEPCFLLSNSSTCAGLYKQEDLIIQPSSELTVSQTWLSFFWTAIGDNFNLSDLYLIDLNFYEVVQITVTFSEESYTRPYSLDLFLHDLVIRVRTGRWVLEEDQEVFFNNFIKFTEKLNNSGNYAPNYGVVNEKIFEPSTFNFWVECLSYVCSLFTFGSSHEDCLLWVDDWWRLHCFTEQLLKDTKFKQVELSEWAKGESVIFTNQFYNYLVETTNYWGLKGEILEDFILLCWLSYLVIKLSIILYFILQALKLLSWFFFTFLLYNKVVIRECAYKSH